MMNAKLEQPRKISKRFSFRLPVSSIGSHAMGATAVNFHGDLMIGGIGYFFPNEDYEQYDYDIDEIIYKDTNIIDVVKFLSNGSLLNNDTIRNATKQFVVKIFSRQDDVFTLLGNALNPAL